MKVYYKLIDSMKIEERLSLVGETSCRLSALSSGFDLLVFLVVYSPLLSLCSHCFGSLYSFLFNSFGFNKILHSGGLPRCIYVQKNHRTCFSYLGMH
uniref:Uncharacterized protein n=1 Tax=Setaria italica TaxID=4555 RepID=K3ZYF1_SETIT